MTNTPAASVGPHVLLLDDDPAITQLLAARLKTHGVHCTAAHTSKAGLQLARSEAPDLIVCDIDMGEGQQDGGDLAYQLRNHPATQRIPLMFLSSMITPADMGARSGGALMVSKLAGIDRIIETILAELRRARPAG
jgi:two-component system alkaline phosphatase synthesis response regulator PhoP